ncbi:hypothetical protein [Clostridium rectalis]|uniref:hypothetical protein n=1 Tax=Clostridium rectalis TaxID=2040295 RepID=UPI000F634C02|nr:hypothetical protein [Clostridium rectalis]
MFAYENFKYNLNTNKVEVTIDKWIKGKDKFLNIVTVPYNTSEIFIKGIINYTNLGKKILYITNEKDGCIELLNEIKRNTLFRKYSYVRSGSMSFHTNLIVCNFKVALNIREKFDLVIYDDIRSISKYESCDIAKLIVTLGSDETKFIAYSTDKIFNRGKELLLPVNKDKNPIIEPRIILTKIDLNKDIPYLVYEYIKWCSQCERKAVIYVPDKDKLDNVFNYLNIYCKRLRNSLIYFSLEDTDLKILNNYMKMKNSIIITDDLEERLFEIKNVDVMVFFADNRAFNYKNLVYFCGKAGGKDKSGKGEVIFLANENTYHMDKAKEVTRRFNKEAWDLGLLNM